jgi:2-keto-4-pentenoate hydratase/2-oxohepta-3-ene-1,7-dioic acid hydratase in catechol pathway
MRDGCWRHAEWIKGPLSRGAVHHPGRRHQRGVPVRRIYCIGRNYAAHAREMGSDPNREPPFFFQKPSDAIQFVAPGTPRTTRTRRSPRNYHYELELVAALHRGGKNVPVDKALDLVYGYAVAWT